MQTPCSSDTPQGDEAATQNARFIRSNSQFLGPAGTTWDYVARRTTIDYLGELRLTDRVAVGSAELVRLGTTSVTARVTLSAPDGRVATELELVIVAIDGKAAPRSRSRTPNSHSPPSGQESPPAGVTTLR